jgi:hypothetical protein
VEALMNSTRDMATEVTDWAKKIDNIRGVLLTSNRANPNGVIDVLSDYNKDDGLYETRIKIMMNSK